MQWFEILIIVLAASVVLGVIIWQIIRKKKGKGGCDCGSSCSHCPHCSTKASEKPTDHSQKSS